MKKILYVLYLMILFIELTIDFSSEKTRKCLSSSSLSSTDKNKVISMLLFHHFVGTFAMYGWLLPNRKLLGLFIFSSCMMLVEWFVLSGYCRLTTYVNQKCNQTGYFRDLLWKLDMKKMDVFDSYTMQHILAIFFLILGILHYTYYYHIHSLS